MMAVTVSINITQLLLPVLVLSLSHDSSMFIVYCCRHSTANNLGIYGWSLLFLFQFLPDVSSC